MNRKLCSKCLRVKDYSEFHSDKSKSTGICAMCAECRNARDRKRAQEKRDCGTLPLFTNETDEPGSARIDGRMVSGLPGSVTLPSAPPPASSEKEKKERKASRDKAYGAMKAGKMVRAQRCSVCGRTREEAGTLQAHHEDYSNPYSVIFLCPTCHQVTHGKRTDSC